MTNAYDLIFIGINPDDANHAATASRIAKLLEIDIQHIEYLLSNKLSGAVKLGLSKEEAKIYQTEVARLGGICNYRPAVGYGNTFELTPIEVRKETFEFSCPACEYTETVESEEALPELCPECGIIPSKFDKVASYKQEREKANKWSPSTPKPREQPAQESTGYQDVWAAWRQQVEDEIRQEIGLEKPSRPRQMGFAILFWLLGMVMGGGFASAYSEIRHSSAAQDCAQASILPLYKPPNSP